MSKPWEYSGVKVNGIVFNSVTGGYLGSGKYTLVADGNVVTKENIQSIDWEHPTIENLSIYKECQLPQDYSYIFDDADYCLARNEWTVKVHISRQLFGDVTQYQEQISALNTTIAEKDTTINETTTALNTANNQLNAANSEIAAKNTEIEELSVALAEADELAIALFEAQQATEDKPIEDENEVPVDEETPTDETVDETPIDETVEGGIEE